MRRGSLFTVFFILLYIINLTAQPKEVLNSAELLLAIKKLNTLGSVLYIAAHPDDENTAALSYFSSGRLLRTGYLALTRGDGGQNLIGTEQSEMLGLLRTQELLEARKIDGAEQFFTRAVDFGYSKSPEETLEKWGRDSILADMVWVIRNFKPDVIVTRFPATGEGGHGHHTASAILAREAFTAAADSSYFPEQLKYTRVWQAKRLYWNAWNPTLAARGDDLNRYLKVDLGGYNPLLGKSYTEAAAESRTMHKSQGFGSSGRRGETLNYFSYTAGDSAAADLFEGIDLSWSRIPGSEEISRALNQLEDNFDAADPAKSLPEMMQVLNQLKELKVKSEKLRSEGEYWISTKIKELEEVIRSAAGIWIEAIAEKTYAYPGGSISVKTGIVNRSDFPFTIKRMGILYNAECGVRNAGRNSECGMRNAESIRNEELGIRNGMFVEEEFKIDIPKDAELSQPYWLRGGGGNGIYTIPDLIFTGKPENDPELTALFTLSAEGTEFNLEAPVYFRRTDPVDGEIYEPFNIIPPVTVSLNGGNMLFTGSEPQSVNAVLVNNGGAAKGILKAELPEGWKIEPERAEFSMDSSELKKSFRFMVTPPSSPSEGMLKFSVSVNGRSYSRDMAVINYPHILKQTLLPEAEIKLVKLDLEKTISSIGYIMGAGDEIPAVLRELGYEVTLLDDNTIENGNLSRFDAVIAGVRAYNTREVLRTGSRNLMNYVNEGGTYLVQYNVSRGLYADPGPYPLELTRQRITDEKAPVTILNGSHTLLNNPNKITEADFKGWIQERGLYFPAVPAEGYETVISSGDDDEKLAGGILYAKYGKGVFIYTGYSWFRQLPAGVPGAVRLFINLISAGGADGNG